MGYGTKVTGYITIVPPLNAAELREHPGFQLTATGQARWGRGYQQECYIEVERHTEPTTEGETVTLTGPRILIVGPDESFSRNLEEQLQAIVTEYYPLGHEFAGYLQLLGEDGDIWRIVVQGDCVTEVRPKLVWPGDDELKEQASSHSEP